MLKWRAVKLTVSHLCLRAGTSDQGGFEGFHASAAAARSSPTDTFPLIPPQTGFKKTAKALVVDAECKKKGGTILSDLKRKDFAAFSANVFFSREQRSSQGPFSAEVELVEIRPV